MAQEFQSFIPKKAAADVPQTKRSRGGIFMLSAVIIFVLAVLAGVGVFFYEKLVAQNIVRKEETLERAKGAFEVDLIRELARIDAKLGAAEGVIDDHIALSAFFDLLQETTLQSVRFSTFDYAPAEESGALTIQMDGVAESFSSVALQSDVFGQSRFILNPIFSDLTLDVFGNVVFTLRATLSGDLVSYGRTVGAVVDPAQEVSSNPF